MIKLFQPLTNASWRDRFKITFWIVACAPVVLAPIQIVFEMVSGLVAAMPFFFAQSFAGAMKRKGFDDPVYKNNLRRLIERNREFEEARKARNEPHS